MRSMYVVGLAAVVSMFAWAPSASADDDCTWNIVSQTESNTGDGGEDCGDGQIWNSYEVYYNEENSCTGETQTVDSGYSGGCCVDGSAGFEDNAC